MKTSAFLVLILFSVTSPVATASKVIFAATELRPYIGETLPNRGYVYQLVTEAYQRVGWEVEIRFYPQARAFAMARNGGVDGLLPVRDSAVLDQNFALSAPFPSGSIALLKRKGRSFGLQPGSVLSPAVLLEKLKSFRFGVVRGALTGSAFDQADYLKKELISSDSLNLEKLFRNRIDLAVIDKYTAADLMVSRYPHMIGELEFIPSVLTETASHIAFSKASNRFAVLSAAFNEGLQRLVDEGRMKQILDYHGLFADHHGSSERKKVRIGAVANPHLLTLKRMAHRFEQQNADIKLEWVVLDEPTLRLRMQSDLAIADGQFDVMAIGPYEAKIWAQRGWLTPLTALPDGYAINDIVTPVRKALSHLETLYALPLYAESSMTYYRKDLFENMGIKMPDAPTYSEIRELAAKVHNPNAGVYGICLRGSAGWGANMALVTTMVNSFGGRWFDEQWNPTLNAPAWYEALSLYRDLLQNYGPPEPHRLDYNRILTLFSEGHCGIWIDATSFAEALSDPNRSNVSRHLGWASAPVAKTQQGSRWLWVWGLAIPAVSKQKAEAMRVISWATSKAYIDMVVQAEGWLAAPPGTRHSTYRSAYQDAVPFAAPVYKAITAADPEHPTLEPVPYQSIQYVDIPEFSSIGTRVGEKIEQILKGELSVEQALMQSQVLVREQMKASGYLRTGQRH